MPGLHPSDQAPMRLGIALPQYGAMSDGRRIAEFAQAAERLGYRSLWVGDRILTPINPSDVYPSAGYSRENPYPPEFTAFLDPFVVLTAAATATTLATLGTSTLNAPCVPPILLARTLTSLDKLSGGRLELGFGTGWLRDEYTATGQSWDARGQLLDDTLAVLDRVWREEVTGYESPHVTIPESRFGLRPSTPGGPRILLAGLGPAAVRRVGRRADGWMEPYGLPAERAEACWSMVRTAAEQAARDPDGLWREIRVNLRRGAVLADAITILRGLQGTGRHGAFVDLHFCTASVDEALEFAAALAAAMGLARS